MFVFHSLKLLILNCKDTNIFLYFLSWPIFVSSVGRFVFPQLADFRFLSWPIFVSLVGRFSFPQLADFHFLSWPISVSLVGRILFPQLAEISMVVGEAK